MFHSGDCQVPPVDASHPTRNTGPDGSLSTLLILLPRFQYAPIDESHVFPRSFCNFGNDQVHMMPNVGWKT
jgi:hypothetical protein